MVEGTSTKQELAELLKKFLLEENPKWYTPDQLELYTLEELLKRAKHFAR
jgi:hypothetical protein